MDPGYLSHSALNCSTSGNTQHLKSIHPFVPTAQQLQFYWQQQSCGTLWGVHRWNAERLDDTSRLRIFIPDIGTHPHRMALQRTARAPHVRLQTTAHDYTNSLWPILRPVCVAHNNKPSTMPPMSNPSWLNPLFNIWLVASIYVYFSVLLITIHTFPQSRLWTRM